ncbi:MAG: hypothetical protein AAF526_03085 [Pseudomonadota bacterium]
MPARPGTAHAAHWKRVIEHLRRHYRLTGAEIADKFCLPRSTVARWLRRLGLGRLSRIEAREPPRRYQRERLGELIHIDIKKLGRFSRPGHRITGDRTGDREGRATHAASAGTSSMSRSTTRRGSLMSRCCQMSGAAPQRVSWSPRYAGSEPAASGSRG